MLFFSLHEDHLYGIVYTRTMETKIETILPLTPLIRYVVLSTFLELKDSIRIFQSEETISPIILLLVN